MRRDSGMCRAEVLALAIVSLLLGSVIVPLLMEHHPHGSPRISCLNNLKQIGTALNIYEADWGGRLPVVPKTQRAPEDKAWPGKMLLYARNKKIVNCLVRQERLTYSFNRRLSGMKQKDITRPASVALVFDSVSDSPLNNNLNGDSVWTPSEKRLPRVGQYVAWREGVKPPRSHWPEWAYPNHNGVINICYADGHARNLGVPGVPACPEFSPHGR